MAGRRFYPSLHFAALTLSQTVVATWYMKAILPYQGWALINSQTRWGAERGSRSCGLLPSRVAERRSTIPLRGAFLVSASFWTR